MAQLPGDADIESTADAPDGAADGVKAPAATGDATVDAVLAQVFELSSQASLDDRAQQATRAHQELNTRLAAAKDVEEPAE